MKSIGGVDVSVILAVRNGERVVAHGVGSALDQRGLSLEVICIDDGSTDGTARILDELKEGDCRLRVKHSHEHLGTGAARNAGMQMATGKYIAFIDADDEYHDPNVLKILFDAAERTRCFVCGGSVQQVEGEWGATREVSIFGPALFGCDGLTPFARYQVPYGFQAFIYSREFLEREGLFFPSLVRYEDPVFFVEAMRRAHRFCALNCVVYRYRTNHKTIDWMSNDCRLLKDWLIGLGMVGKIANAEGYDRLMELVVGDVLKIVGLGDIPPSFDDSWLTFFDEMKTWRLIGVPLWKRVFRAFSQERHPLFSSRIRQLFGIKFVLQKLYR